MANHWHSASRRLPRIDCVALIDFAHLLPCGHSPLADHEGTASQCRLVALKNVKLAHPQHPGLDSRSFHIHPREPQGLQRVWKHLEERQLSRCSMPEFA